MEKGRFVMRKTKEVSHLVGVSKRTLQYYDDKGLLDVKRDENNYRLFDEEDMNQIWFILLYKEMGLNEIGCLLLDQENRKKRIYLQVHKLENLSNKMKEQMEFILEILERGFPEKPQAEVGKTYVECIQELRRTLEYSILN